ncbi:hypothetical protein ACU686_00235 [Yinghuangia aomiensis]
MRVGIFSGAAIADDATLLAKVRNAPEMTGADLAGEVATKEPYVVPAVGAKKFTVAALDLGIKGMTPHRMAERGIEVHVLPANATADDVYAVDPDGVSSSPTAPATPPPPTTRSPSPAPSWTAARRSSASASATRSSAARSASAPTS